ncbi:MAG: hypothetical protein HY908_24755 [Myxococcales bacterium]|nr:hypothetical protein [Myxococcales bacterium]
MAYTNYYFMVHQGPDSAVRASLNDVPFYRFDDPVAATRTGPAIHLLKPGTNVLSIEIDRAPAYSQVFVELSVDCDHERAAVYREWPKLCEELPARERHLPLRYSTTFEPEGELFLPAYLDAPPQEFDRQGTPELREAVRAVHAAIAGKDVGEYTRRLELKVDEHRRAYAHWDDLHDALATDELAGFFGEELLVRPLELDRLCFDARAGGRVAHVTHLDGGYVIEAVSITKGELDKRIRTDLTLTWHAGAWRVFR